MREDPDLAHEARREAAHEEDSARFGGLYAEMKRRAAMLDSRARLMAPHVKGSETSLQAAKRAVESFRATQRDTVFTAYYRAGSRGLTDRECEGVTGLDGSSQRPRRYELDTEHGIGVLKKLEGVKRDGCEVYVLAEYAPEKDEPQGRLPLDAA